ncbi:hypothetical protein MmiEs2_01980 [Methanimicrococcus stummii]|uniref:TM2 domain-containing protein n=1 Tax=Methanimicrococcus stummii TaxID=3028294 RepID=A0AA96V882_9EURY|nr:hypothetical protein [Methanimicrococcus sp. Es2]WNY28018.1 hypothetical protein MmiEs2_01980 [Methanimicrococcus sp. Es2]
MANSVLAAVFSFFIPGLGQFYCGQFLKGIMVFIGAAVVSAISFFIPVIGFLIVLLYWLWNIYDAYTSALRT